MNKYNLLPMKEIRSDIYQGRSNQKLCRNLIGKESEHTWINVWRRQWQPTPVLLPGISHGQMSLVGWRRLHFPFSLSCTGEGNGNPLQCSCLENPRDGRAWWAAVYGVAQSQTRLVSLSSSSSSRYMYMRNVKNSVHLQHTQHVFQSYSIQQ